MRLIPNPAFDAEKLTAYELGYRTHPLPYLLFSTSAFFNPHQNSLSTELLPAFVEDVPAPRLILPVTFDNGLHGNSHGVEMTGDLRPVSWLRWTANYSWLRIQMTRNTGSADVSQERRYEGLSPRHQLFVQTAVDLPRGVHVDWHLRYVSELPAGSVPSYATSRLRLAWQPTSRVELAVVGEDLHEARHREWLSEGGAIVELRRAAHVSLTWRP